MQIFIVEEQRRRSNSFENTFFTHRSSDGDEQRFFESGYSGAGERESTRKSNKSRVGEIGVRDSNISGSGGQPLLHGLEDMVLTTEEQYNINFDDEESPHKNIRSKVVKSTDQFIIGECMTSSSHKFGKIHNAKYDYKDCVARVVKFDRVTKYVIDEFFTEINQYEGERSEG